MERMFDIEKTINDIKEYAELLDNYRVLEEENKKLKSDLSECECSMHFENDEVGYRKRECKKLKEEVRFLEECLDRKEKLNEKYRFLEECLDNKEKVNKSLREELEKLKSTYVYDAKQVRDIC